MIILIEYILFLVPLLVAVAFLTLLERKLMAAVQGRLGPNSVGVFGLLQAVADGVKLVLKKTNLPASGDQLFFLLAPVMSFVLAVLSWLVIPGEVGHTLGAFDLAVLWVLAVGSLGVVAILLAGWSSGSKYAYIGCVRSAAQMISYELPLGIILLVVCMLCQGTSHPFSLEYIMISQGPVSFGLPLVLLVLMWVLVSMAETNRAPFDLPEAEAELVAGYNVEYSAFGFALFFLAEYAHMVLLSVVSVIVFVGSEGWILAVGSVLYMSLFVMIRAALPRFRYDLLMRLGWQILLPISFGAFMTVLSVSMICYV
jgi:NADH-quinone oxidoreductase subunit H